MLVGRRAPRVHRSSPIADGTLSTVRDTRWDVAPPWDPRVERAWGDDEHAGADGGPQPRSVPRALATHRARDGEIAFGGQFTPAAQASFSVSATKDVSMSWEHRSGPKSSSDTSLNEASAFDQCIFLHYYKVKHRPFFVPKVIRAGTDEPHLSRTPTPEDPNMMTQIPEEEGTPMDEVEMIPRRSHQVRTLNPPSCADY